MAWQACKKAHLTDGQIRVAELMARGYANRRIAKELSIANNTVRRYQQDIRIRLSIPVSDDYAGRVTVVERLRKMGLGKNEI